MSETDEQHKAHADVAQTLADAQISELMSVLREVYDEGGDGPAPASEAFVAGLEIGCHIGLMGPIQAYAVAGSIAISLHEEEGMEHGRKAAGHIMDLLTAATRPHKAAVRGVVTDILMRITPKKEKDDA